MNPRSKATCLDAPGGQCERRYWGIGWQWRGHDLVAAAEVVALRSTFRSDESRTAMGRGAVSISARCRGRVGESRGFRSEAVKQRGACAR
jgi:hypothetical protein